MIRPRAGPVAPRQPCDPCEPHAHQPRALCDHCLAGRGDDPSDGRRRVDRARQDPILSVALDRRWLPSPEQLPAFSLKATCRVRHVEVSVLGARRIRRVDWRGMQRRATDSGAVGSPRKESSQGQLIYATRPGPVVTAGLLSRRSPNGPAAARRVGAALVRKGFLEHNLHPLTLRQPAVLQTHRNASRRWYRWHYSVLSRLTALL